MAFPRSMSMQWLLLTAMLLTCGCRVGKRESAPAFAPESPVMVTPTEMEIEYPDAIAAPSEQVLAAQPPFTLGQQWPPPFRNMTLEEAIKISLKQSDVLRDMGGLVLRSPEALRTVYDPALRVTDPRTGVEASLSAFDAIFSASAFFEKNDRALNNYIEGMGTNLFQQDLGLYNFELFKRTGVGTELSLRNLVDYNFNNSPANSDPNLPWTARIEGELRQPLLQGAGAMFNGIAGPNGKPGFNTGVLIARNNSDISLTEFEAGVRDLVNHVENAYWELYFAYRDLDAKIAARDRALRTWEAVRALYDTGRRGGDAEQEAQAREQYFRLQVNVENALAGQVVEKSNANVFHGSGGVLFQERRLRRAMGLAASDGALIRPSDEPPLVQVRFCWEDAVQESMARRVEMRQQRWKIARAEMELVAARNYLKPRLDSVARYRFRGLGHDLMGSNANQSTRFGDAYQNLTGGDFQEWEMGLELSVPIGYRLAHTTVRNAELRLARVRAVLHEQEQEVISDLSSAVAEADRAYVVAQTNCNRRAAADNQLNVLEVLYEQADESDKPTLLNRLLDAQRRLADADSSFYRALAAYAFAIKQVHYEKGSLLDYDNICLSEGCWPEKAYQQAAHRRKSHARTRQLNNYILANPHTRDLDGAVQQDALPIEEITRPSQGELDPYDNRSNAQYD